MQFTSLINMANLSYHFISCTTVNFSSVMSIKVSLRLNAVHMFNKILNLTNTLLKHVLNLHTT